MTCDALEEMDNITNAAVQPMEMGCMEISAIITVVYPRHGSLLRIKEGDEEKAAFLTPYGLFEPTVMFLIPPQHSKP